jgi:hypothetical protein
MARSLEDKKIVQENALQLYIYENLCCTPLNRMKEFLTNMVYQQLKKISGSAKFKIIIPECPVKFIDSNGEEKVKQVDFRLIDKNNKSVNIEVEWKVSNFNYHGKEVYDNLYKDDKGFIISLENDKKPTYIQESNIKIINPNEFQLWFILNSEKLIDRTISNRTSNYLGEAKNIWLIPLLGAATNNFINKVLHSKIKCKKWAFPYIHFNQAMRNIFDIKAGDNLVFIGDFKGHGGKKADYKESKFSILMIGKVKKGYYCDLYDNTFEDLSWNVDKIYEKKYMHYFEFELDNYNTIIYIRQQDNEYFNYPMKRYLNYQGNQEIWEKICEEIKWSTSQLSCPVKISQDKYDFLKQMKLQYEIFKD